MTDITRVPSRGLRKNLVINLASGSETEPSLRIGDNNNSYESVLPTGLYSPGSNQIAITLDGVQSTVFKPNQVVFKSTYENQNNILEENEELALTSFGDVGFHKDLYVRGTVYAEGLVLSSQGFNNYPVISIENVIAMRAGTVVPKDGQVAMLVDGVTPGDGRGGFYVWRPNSIEPEDEQFNVVKLTTINTGRYVRVSNGRHNPFTIYVAPHHQAADDRVTNNGNDPERPFGCIERACAEVARRFIDSRYNKNGEFTGAPQSPINRLEGNERFAIYVEASDSIVDNRVGATTESDITFNLGASLDSAGVRENLWRLNPPETLEGRGGIIIPRGTSIMGRDLRKVTLRPVFVPNPTDSSIRSCIFRMTGGTFFMNFTFKDKLNATSSHHKLACFEFTSQQQLELYYKKVARFFGLEAPALEDIDGVNNPSADEYNIVTGNPTFDFGNVNQVSGNTFTSADNSVSSASPYIFSCSLRSVWGMCGIMGNGDLVGGIKSYLAAQFTVVSLQKDARAFYRGLPVTSGEASQKRFRGSYINEYDTTGLNGDWRHFGYRVTNNAYSQLVSCFCIGPAIHYWADKGGEFSITNSTSNFGDVSLFADSYRKGNPFIQDILYKIIGVIPPQEIPKDPANDLRNVSLGQIRYSGSSSDWQIVNNQEETELTLTSRADLFFYYDNNYSIQYDLSDDTRRKVYIKIFFPQYDSENPIVFSDIDGANEVIGQDNQITNPAINGYVPGPVEFEALVVGYYEENTYIPLSNTNKKVNIDKLSIIPKLRLDRLRVSQSSENQAIIRGKYLKGVHTNTTSPADIARFMELVKNNSPTLYSKRFIDSRSREDKLYKFRIVYPTTLTYNGITSIKTPPPENYILAIKQNYSSTNNYVAASNEVNSTDLDEDRLFAVGEILNNKDCPTNSQPHDNAYWGATLSGINGTLGLSGSNLSIQNGAKYADVIFVNVYKDGKNNVPHDSYDNILNLPIVDLNTENPANIKEYESIDPITNVVTNSYENRVTTESIMRLLDQADPGLDWTGTSISAPSNIRYAVKNFSAPYSERGFDDYVAFNSNRKFIAIFKRPSIIRCGGQTWEFMGNYNYDTSLPPGQFDFPGFGIDQDNIEITNRVERFKKEISKLMTQVRGGRIYATGMDDKGRFFIGFNVFDIRTGVQEDLRNTFVDINAAKGDNNSSSRSAIFENLIVTNNLNTNNFTATGNFNIANVTITDGGAKKASQNSYGFVKIATESEAVQESSEESKVINPALLKHWRSNSIIARAGISNYGFARKATNEEVKLQSSQSDGFITPEQLKIWSIERKFVSEAAPTLMPIPVSPTFNSHIVDAINNPDIVSFNSQTGHYTYTVRGVQYTIITYDQYVASVAAGNELIKFDKFREDATQDNNSPNNAINTNTVYFNGFHEAEKYINNNLLSSDIASFRLLPGLYPIANLNFERSIILDGQTAWDKVVPSEDPVKNRLYLNSTGSDSNNNLVRALYDTSDIDEITNGNQTDDFQSPKDDNTHKAKSLRWSVLSNNWPAENVILYNVPHTLFISTINVYSIEFINGMSIVGASDSQIMNVGFWGMDKMIESPYVDWSIGREQLIVRRQNINNTLNDIFNALAAAVPSSSSTVYTIYSGGVIEFSSSQKLLTLRDVVVGPCIPSSIVSPEGFKNQSGGFIKLKKGNLNLNFGIFLIGNCNWTATNAGMKFQNSVGNVSVLNGHTKTFISYATEDGILPKTSFGHRINSPGIITNRFVASRCWYFLTNQNKSGLYGNRNGGWDVRGPAIDAFVNLNSNDAAVGIRSRFGFVNIPVPSNQRSLGIIGCLGNNNGGIRPKGLITGGKSSGVYYANYETIPIEPTYRERAMISDTLADIPWDNSDTGYTIIKGGKNSQVFDPVTISIWKSAYTLAERIESIAKIFTSSPVVIPTDTRKIGVPVNSTVQDGSGLDKGNTQGLRSGGARYSVGRLVRFFSEGSRETTLGKGLVLSVEYNIITVAFYGSVPAHDSNLRMVVVHPTNPALIPNTVVDTNSNNTIDDELMALEWANTIRRVTFISNTNLLNEGNNSYLPSDAELMNIDTIMIPAIPMISGFVSIAREDIETGNQITTNNSLFINSGSTISNSSLVI